jgi:hypothetical protein
MRGGFIATAMAAFALAGLGGAPARAQPAPPAERPMIYVMEQLVTGPVPPEVLKQMEPLHTLDDVEALLKANKIAFGWRQAEVNSSQIDPRVAQQIGALPPHEVFIAPQGQDWIISVILSSRPEAEAAPPPVVAPPLQTPAPAPKSKPARPRGQPLA